MSEVGKISDALDKFQQDRSLSGPNRKPAVVAVKPQAVRDNRDPAAMVELQKRIQLNKFTKNLITVLKPASFEAEQFRMLKSLFLFPASGVPPRSILVTSAVPSEGKSFVSANLAVSIAQNINEYVLLVDCDLRRPTIHKYFEIGEGEGLSDYLAGDMALSSLLHKTVIDKLTVLPGGRPVKNPAELLSSRKMSELLHELQSRYSDRHIVVDSPPPILTSETNVIARQVDGIILVVKYRSTPKKLVAELTEMLGKEKMLGVVVNMCDFKSASHSYNKYGRYTDYYKSYINE